MICMWTLLHVDTLDLSTYVELLYIHNWRRIWGSAIPTKSIPRQTASPTRWTYTSRKARGTQVNLHTLFYVYFIVPTSVFRAKLLIIPCPVGNWCSKIIRLSHKMKSQKFIGNWAIGSPFREISHSQFGETRRCIRWKGRLRALAHRRKVPSDSKNCILKWPLNYPAGSFYCHIEN